MSDYDITKTRAPIDRFRIIQIVVGVLSIAFLSWRLYTVISSGVYGPDTWVRFALSGLIIGSVYSVIAIGYTLVYGILFMINFAHGEIVMLGAFAGYFIFEIMNTYVVDPITGQNILNAYPWLSVILAFAVGMIFCSNSRFFPGENCISTIEGSTSLDPVNQRHRGINLSPKCCPTNFRPKTSNLYQS